MFSQAWNLTLELCKSHITIRPEVLIEGSVTCMKLGKEKFKKAVTLYFYCKYSRVQKQSSFFKKADELLVGKYISKYILFFPSKEFPNLNWEIVECISFLQDLMNEIKETRRNNFCNWQNVFFLNLEMVPGKYVIIQKFTFQILKSTCCQKTQYFTGADQS